MCPRRSPRPDPSRRGGFTLVELLIVVGLVSLLVAVLLPALSKARDAARTVRCTSNLKQVATGLLMYATDHRGQLPYNTAGGLPQTHPDYLAFTDWPYFVGQLSPDEAAKLAGAMPSGTPAENRKRRAKVGASGYVPWSHDRTGRDVFVCPSAVAQMTLDLNDAQGTQNRYHYSANPKLIVTQQGSADPSPGVVSHARITQARPTTVLAADASVRLNSAGALYVISTVEVGGPTDQITRRLQPWPLQTIDRSSTLLMRFPGHGGSNAASRANVAYADASVRSVDALAPQDFALR